MSNTSTTVQVGPGAGVTLFIVLLLLKVFEVVDWSWWIITAPLWAGFALVLIMLTVGGILVGIANVIDHFDRKRKRKTLAARRGYGNPNLTKRK